MHPQFWPDDLDYSGKRVLVIGSGATAVTIVPEMAKTAANVTMLQRSPTYMAARPSEDALANALSAKLPARLAYGLTRLRNVALSMHLYRLFRKYPDKAKARLLELAGAELGPQVDLADFTPRYNAWDQRLCLVPDADFFHAVRDGNAQVVTDVHRHLYAARRPHDVGRGAGRRHRRRRDGTGAQSARRRRL